MMNFPTVKKGLITALFTLAVSSLFAQNLLPAPRHGKTYVIAHRGAHHGIPENTLAAYQKAIELGCDFIEIDVRTTKDGAIVSVHNSTIDAYVIQGKGSVKDLTLNEIRALDIGEKVGAEWRGTRVPTFEEILKLSQGKIGIYLDLKDGDPQVLIPMLRKYKMAEKTVWYLSAGNRELIQSIQKQCAECLVMPDPGNEANISKVIDLFNPRVLATDMGVLSASFVAQAQQSKAMVFVDEKAGDQNEWAKILSFGTDGIQTDHPEALITYLQSLQK